MIGIYKITNQVNNKSYIGQSVNIKRRWNDHRSHAYEKKTTLQKAMCKYGIDNFKFEILEECKIKELNDKEKYYIKYYDTYNNGYNETLGGSGTSANGTKLTWDKVKSIINLLKDTDILQHDIAILYNVSKDTIFGINHGRIWRQDNIDYPIREYVEIKKTKYCKICGKEISSQAMLCLTCENERRSKKPPKEELYEKLLEKQNFSAVGKQYGVTGTSVRRWCIKYNLPDKIDYYKNYVAGCPRG